MRVRSALVATVLLAAMPAAASTTLFSDNFDGEGAPGVSVLNYNGFANWTVSGNVDLVAMPNGFGISCSGKCVDLDGSSGPGSITSTPINFVAGRKLTVSFDLSGSQRSSAADNFRFTVKFGGPTDLTGFLCTAGFVVCGAGDFFGLVDLGLYQESIPGTNGFNAYSLRFTPTQAGSLTLFFDTTSADNIGPLLDNVLVTQSAIPEPQSWALLIAGFGLVGAAQRGRRRALAA